MNPLLYIGIGICAIPFVVYFYNQYNEKRQYTSDVKIPKIKESPLKYFIPKRDTLVTLYYKGNIINTALDKDTKNVIDEKGRYNLRLTNNQVIATPMRNITSGKNILELACGNSPLIIDIDEIYINEQERKVSLANEIVNTMSEQELKDYLALIKRKSIRKEKELIQITGGEDSRKKLIDIREEKGLIGKGTLPTPVETDKNKTKKVEDNERKR